MPDPAEAPLRDALGTLHPMAHDARIVCLVPSLTELLFDLGLGDRVVGRTTFCVHPRDRVRHVARVGGTKTPRIDRIRALEPTHVIVNVDENRREDVETMSAFIPHVVVTHPMGPRDNPGIFRLFGGIFGRGARAAALCADFERAAAALERRATTLPARRVLYLIWREPWMTISPDTYIARVLEMAGCKVIGVPGSERYPQVRIDAALLDRTDAVLLSSEPFPFKEKHRAEIEALAPGPLTVRHIDGEMTSWYGSRAIRGLDYLASFVEDMSRPA